MSETALFVFFLAAIAIGWLLGRRPKLEADLSWLKTTSQPSVAPPYQFEASGDQALDDFIQALSPSADNLDWHMGLARLMRQQGEFERAIRIHQSLLASGLLAPALAERVQFELVQDYLKAGLQDRAEELLLALLSTAGAHKQTYLMRLLDLYQRQQEWQRAIDIALQLSGKRRLFKNILEQARGDSKDKLNMAEIGFQLAHFYCQLAEQSDDVQQRYRYIKRALQADKHCQRAQLAAFEMEVAAQQWSKADKSLAKINSQAPQLLLECRTSLASYFANATQGQNYLDFLAQWAQRLELDSAWCFYLEALAQEQLEQALAVLEQRLAEKSSLPLLELLARLQLKQGAQEQQVLGIYQRQLAEFQRQNQHKAYRCKRCGFEAQSLHWQCPSCFSWAVMALKQ